METTSIVTGTQQQEIFDHWLKMHTPLVFKVVRLYAFNTMDRDDLFQEIMIQVWHSIPAFRQQSAATTWLYRISINTAIKWERKERKHRLPGSLEDLRPVLQETGIASDPRLIWLYEEISKLDKIDRSVVLLLLENFSYKEMAGILGITESNVGVKINRLKKHLTLKSKKYDHYAI